MVGFNLRDRESAKDISVVLLGYRTQHDMPSKRRVHHSKCEVIIIEKNVKSFK
jgi:hypothetical protein